MASRTGCQLLFRATKQSQYSLRQAVGEASASTTTSTYQQREVRTRNSMSEVGDGEGGSSSAPGARDDSQSSTAAPPPPSADGNDDEESWAKDLLERDWC